MHTYTRFVVYGGGSPRTYSNEALARAYAKLVAEDMPDVMVEMTKQSITERLVWRR